LVMRFAAAMFASLLSCAAAFAGTFGDEWRVGQVASFQKQDSNYYFEVVEVVGREEVVLKGVRREMTVAPILGQSITSWVKLDEHAPFVVVGLPTYGLAPGQRVDLEIEFAVVGTTTFKESAAFVIKRTPAGLAARAGFARDSVAARTAESSAIEGPASGSGDDSLFRRVLRLLGLVPKPAVQDSAIQLLQEMTEPDEYAVNP